MHKGLGFLHEINTFYEYCQLSKQKKDFGEFYSAYWQVDQAWSGKIKVELMLTDQ